MEYLEQTYDWNNSDLVTAIDNTSIWSSKFGELIFDNIQIKPYDKILDIACGTGFPTLDLSERLGSSCIVFGIDIWEAGLKRAKWRAEILGIKNVKFINCDASEMPFDDNGFDLIVSNLGINNFEKPLKVFQECFRVLKADSHLLLTTNPKGHMKEFYEIYIEVLNEMDLEESLELLDKNINHRLTEENINQTLKESGFRSIDVIRDSFVMRFLNGTAFLNHSFIKMGFLEGWKDFLEPEMMKNVFQKLEQKLNLLSIDERELKLTIPRVFIDARK